jgi:REP element-mobilizing transposase RayT
MAQTPALWGLRCPAGTLFRQGNIAGILSASMPVYMRTYRRAPLFLSERFRRCFVQRLEEVRQELKFLLLGWVLMPDHFHLLLLTKPAETTPLILKGLKMRRSSMWTGWDEPPVFTCPFRTSQTPKSRGLRQPPTTLAPARKIQGHRGDSVWYDSPETRALGLSSERSETCPCNSPRLFVVNWERTADLQNRSDALRTLDADQS